MKRLLSQLAVVVIIASTVAIAQTSKSDPGVPASPDVSLHTPYQPITGTERLSWFVQNTIGLRSLGAGLLSAGLGTAMDSPKEYGGSWEGFGKRYGMRLTGVSTGNVMEAGLGDIWGEDPRYFRAGSGPFVHRVLHVVKLTFTARDRDGNVAPAYARYIGIAGNNFLSNTWRAQSEADTQHALTRTALGFVGRMGGDAFQEFWPDVRQHIWHKKP
jgi:hypothetical protein